MPTSPSSKKGKGDKGEKPQVEESSMDEASNIDVASLRKELESLAAETYEDMSSFLRTRTAENFKAMREDWEKAKNAEPREGLWVYEEKLHLAHDALDMLVHILQFWELQGTKDEEEKYKMVYMAFAVDILAKVLSTDLDNTWASLRTIVRKRFDPDQVQYRQERRYKQKELIAQQRKKAVDFVEWKDQLDERTEAAERERAERAMGNS